jgi:hypothetical protein
LLTVWAPPRAGTQGRRGGRPRDCRARAEAIDRGGSPPQACAQGSSGGAEHCKGRQLAHCAAERPSKTAAPVRGPHPPVPLTLVAVGLLVGHGAPRPGLPHRAPAGAPGPGPAPALGVRHAGHGRAHLPARLQPHGLSQRHRVHLRRQGAGGRSASSAPSSPSPSPYPASPPDPSQSATPPSSPHNHTWCQVSSLCRGCAAHTGAGPALQQPTACCPPQ